MSGLLVITYVEHRVPICVTLIERSHSGLLGCLSSADNNLTKGRVWKFKFHMGCHSAIIWVEVHRIFIYLLPLNTRGLAGCPSNLLSVAPHMFPQVWLPTLFELPTFCAFFRTSLSGSDDRSKMTGGGLDLAKHCSLAAANVLLCVGRMASLAYRTQPACNSRWSHALPPVYR